MAGRGLFTYAWSQLMAELECVNPGLFLSQPENCLFTINTLVVFSPSSAFFFFFKVRNKNYP